MMGWNPGGMGGWGPWGWFGGIIGFLFMIAFWVGVIALIIWGVRLLTRSSEPRTREQTPLDIAKARYARGEITQEQFEQLKKDLS